MGSLGLFGAAGGGPAGGQGSPGIAPHGPKMWRPDAMTLLFIGGSILGFGAVMLGMLSFLAMDLFPLFGGMCIPGLILPGAVLLAWGVVAWRRERRLEEFASWLRAHRREKMDTLAQRLGTNRYGMELLLGKAIEKGLVKGVVDRSTDEFVCLQAAGSQVFVGKCPQCGGDVNRWAFPEERFTCPYCEQSVTVPVEA